MLFGDEHVRRYEETDGEVGHDWENGAPTLILTTKGRKTGKERKFALIYQEHEGDYVIVASKGGADEHPGWYHNLVADPQVTVQVKADKFAAKARTASESEKAVLWPKMAAVWPAFDDYQKKTDRDIPVVVLERVA
ncbi:nitroreductase family deazaflavin-dependent oxidoreductase [Prauserella sp. PE36]|uniref:nitroreductase family deazaflavin-dependent oxidoreductase n=1 Tax=Prauserella sp. PE36 TaxID=1504709 RepID=UPI000D8E692B|nr:nitroreductase family deazaflavin-dependent oxidoreductase [Prauserella sp. PE36]PXY21747.1 nitroreductase [Prauserella coralliicola]RBM20129.1 nitroreductase family deazaflavin-dependent oxidoreductase [Prauserella sp. PE36]